MRNLARRSAEAARTTAERIAEAAASAEEGARTNTAVTTAFSDIQKRIVELQAVVNDIALASHEQGGGIAQISTAVEQMSGATQAAAASSEQSSATSEELAAQSAALRELVQQFRLTTVLA